MATNSVLTSAPMRQVHSVKKKKGTPGPKHDITPKDMAYDRNFTKQGKPKLNATSMDSGSGQRR